MIVNVVVCSSFPVPASSAHLQRIHMAVLLSSPIVFAGEDLAANSVLVPKMSIILITWADFANLPATPPDGLVA